ncbi:MAG: CHAP domain-containing protein [Methyloglobulus sp.]|nr:CHAP domain-containing protein [Methyloglobulus sp.]
MYISRRKFIMLTPFILASGKTLLANDHPYIDYPFIDYFAPKEPDDGFDEQGLGVVSAGKDEIALAKNILSKAPTTNPLDVMNFLANINQKNSSGELYNERWADVGNPVIVKFFHDVGYKQEKFPNSDCTPWCAATLSWCLYRSRRTFAKDPVSSQSYLEYGIKTKDPKEGDIVVFTDTSDNSRGHVGLFLKNDNDNVIVLGGNQAQEYKSKTNCGKDYPNNKIRKSSIYKNSNKDKGYSLYLNSYITYI